MTTRRTILKAAALVAGVLGLLVVLGVALAPRWVNLGPLHARIEAAASSALGGALKYERIDLSWFPRPEVVVRALELSVPGKVRGTVRSVSFSPALLPLLGGQVRLTRVAVDGLDLTVEISEPAVEEEPGAAQDPFQAIRSLAPEGEKLVLELHDGRAQLVRKGETLEIDGLRVEVAVSSVEGKNEITLSRLSARSPRFLVAATLRTRDTAPGAELTVRGNDLDVTEFRKKLLSFAGDVPALAEVFAILRGGTLPSFSLAAHGETPADLGVFERMSIRASLAGGRVRIEGAGIEIGAARGDVSIEGGVLTAGNVEAEVGRAEVKDGSLLVGLGKSDDRVRVEAKVRADLAELPALLSRILGDRSVLDELSLVEDLEGTASGQITIEGRAEQLDTTVAVSSMRFSCRTRRIPWPVRVDGGTFFFDGARVGLSRLRGSVGSSTFSQVAARVRLGNSPVIEGASGTVTASLAELFSPIAARDGMEPLRTTVRQLEGSARLSVARLSGPFVRPQDWRFQATGAFEDLLLDATFLPGPLAVSSGGIELDAETIRLKRLEARTLDAVLRASGTIHGYREGTRTIEATADGEVGPEGVRWVWQRAALPADFLPAAPIALRDVRLGIPRPGELSLRGTFTSPRGPRVTLDFVSDQDGADVENLEIADGDALASMAIRREGDAREIRFQGRLDGSTVAKLFAGRRERRGRIESGFCALLPKERIGQTMADGMLSVTDFDVPTPAGNVAIERLDVRGEGKRLVVAPSSLVLDEQRFSVEGSATFRDEGIDLDGDVSTGDLAWTSVERIVDRVKKAGKEPVAGVESGIEVPARARTTAPSAPPLAVSGALRVSLDSFRYGNLTWAPVLFDVRLEGESATAAVRKAEICGISTTGGARTLPDGTMAVDVAVDSAGPDVSVPLACLGLVGDAAMTGRYEASLKAEASGEASQLLRTARGPLTFKATEGSLGKVKLLTRVLGVLNLTDVFAAKDGGRVGEAMPFRELSVEGEVGDGGVSIREGVLSTPSFAMAASGRVGYLDGALDLMVLSQPLSTLDKVVQAVPIVRNILGKDFLSVAAKVTGNVEDPKVHVTPARDVGKGLVHILERTVKLPVTIFDPPPPRESPR